MYLLLNGHLLGSTSGCGVDPRVDRGIKGRGGTGKLCCQHNTCESEASELNVQSGLCIFLRPLLHSSNLYNLSPFLGSTAPKVMASRASLVLLKVVV
jgi:hypothetical protein